MGLVHTAFIQVCLSFWAPHPGMQKASGGRGEELGGKVGGGDKKRPLWLVNIPSQMWEGLMKPHLSPGRCPRSMVGVGMGHIL